MPILEKHPAYCKWFEGCFCHPCVPGLECRALASRGCLVSAFLLEGEQGGSHNAQVEDITAGTVTLPRLLVEVSSAIPGQTENSCVNTA